MILDCGGVWCHHRAMVTNVKKLSLVNAAGFALLGALALLFFAVIPAWQWLEPSCLEKRLPYEGQDGLVMVCHPDDINPRSMAAWTD